MYQLLVSSILSTVFIVDLRHMQQVSFILPHAEYPSMMGCGSI